MHFSFEFAITFATIKVLVPKFTKITGVLIYLSGYVHSLIFIAIHQMKITTECRY
jgi:hypothetical protein